MKLSAEKIKDTVCEYYGIDMKELMGSSRRKDIIQARHTTLYLLQTLGKLSQAKAGLQVNKDHATAYCAKKKINGWIEIYPSVREEITEIKNEICKMQIRKINLDSTLPANYKTMILIGNES